MIATELVPSTNPSIWILCNVEVIPHISIKFRRCLNGCISAVLEHQNESKEIVTTVLSQTSKRYSTQTVRFRTRIPPWTINFVVLHNILSATDVLGHGCARVAHCVTARWRNFSHYCRPLRHYDVWLRVQVTEKYWQPRRQHTVYRNKRLEFATEQVGKLRYVTAVDGGLKRFPWVAWFAHPCFRDILYKPCIL